MTWLQVCAGERGRAGGGGDLIDRGAGGKVSEVPREPRRRRAVSY